MSYRPTGPNPGFAEGSSGMSAHAPEAFSLVDRYSVVEGTLATRRDLRIEGEMRGTLRCQGLLFVAEGADVDATVEAGSVAVAGQLRGTVTCHGRLQIMPTGRVLAAVTTETLVINEGAIYEGELQMTNEGQTTTLTATAGDVAGGPPSLRRLGGEDEPPGLRAPRVSRGEV